MVFPAGMERGASSIWSNSNPAWQGGERNSEGTGGLSDNLRIAHREGRLPAGRFPVCDRKSLLCPC